MPATLELTAILFLAFLCEGLVEYLARPIIHGFGKPEPDPAQPAPSPMWLRYAAMGLGVGLAVAFRADLFAAAGVQPVNPWIAWVLTGLIIGRGSNYVHDLIDTWRAGAGAQRG